MPWTEMSKMDDRLIFIAACLRGEVSMSETCLRHGISRKTGYKWLERVLAGGSGGAGSLELGPPHGGASD